VIADHFINEFLQKYRTTGSIVIATPPNLPRMVAVYHAPGPSGRTSTATLLVEESPPHYFDTTLIQYELIEGCVDLVECSLQNRAISHDVRLRSYRQSCLVLPRMSHYLAARDCDASVVKVEFAPAWRAVDMIRDENWEKELSESSRLVSVA
jgi:hypothetical protein